jgi:hypothetical protein
MTTMHACDKRSSLTGADVCLYQTVEVTDPPPCHTRLPRLAGLFGDLRVAPRHTPALPSLLGQLSRNMVKIAATRYLRRPQKARLRMRPSTLGGPPPPSRLRLAVEERAYDSCILPHLVLSQKTPSFPSNEGRAECLRVWIGLTNRVTGS